MNALPSTGPDLRRPSATADHPPHTLTTCDRFQRDGVSLYLLDLGGDVTSGHRPFGYRVGPDRRLVPDPAEQAAIGRIRELRQSGLSLRAVARTVHAECGVTVSAMTVRRVLSGWTPVTGGTLMG
jgi:hypothetical protein